MHTLAQWRTQERQNIWTRSRRDWELVRVLARMFSCQKRGSNHFVTTLLPDIVYLHHMDLDSRDFQGPQGLGG